MLQKTLFIVFIYMITNGSCYYYTCRNKYSVALTFDDGPYFTVTSDILTLLFEENVKATFFVCAQQLLFEENVEILQRIHADGHLIGSHTYRHKDLKKLSDFEIMKEMNDTSDAIYAAIKKRPRLMRPPYGSIDDRVVNLLTNFGYEIIMWNIDTRDWDISRDSQMVTNDVKRDMYDENLSGIIVMHDVHLQTYHHLSKLIKMLKSEKIQIVPLDKCVSLEVTPYHEMKIESSGAKTFNLHIYMRLLILSICFIKSILNKN